MRAKAELYVIHETELGNHDYGETVEGWQFIILSEKYGIDNFVFVIWWDLLLFFIELIRLGDRQFYVL